MELNTGVNVTVRRNIAVGVSGAARNAVQRGIVERSGPGAELVDVSNELRIVEDLAQLRISDTETENASIAIHLRSNGRIGSHLNTKLLRQRSYTRIIMQVLAHEHVRHGDIDATRFEQPYGGHRALQRTRQLGDAVMNLGPVRVNTDLHRLDTQFANKIRLLLADHEGVGLDLYIESQLARVPEDIEEIHAHQHFAAAQRKKENSRVGKLIEETLQLQKGHLAVVIVIQVAVHTALVTAVSDVQVCAERDAQFQGPGVKLLHERGRHRPLSASAGDGLAGSFVSNRRPRSASSLTRCSASARATSGSTSNSAQTLPLTISQRGVAPCAAFQISETSSLIVY